MNITYCTYCSRGKSKQEGTLPAIERYQSQRIRWVYQKALADNCSFSILSGKYGLIPPDFPLPWYDHLLVAEEVNRMVTLVIDQLSKIRPGEIRFFSNPTEYDSNLFAYLTVMEQSCQHYGIRLVIPQFSEIMPD